jgi:hypothetical protein
MNRLWKENVVMQKESPMIQQNVCLMMKTLHVEQRHSAHLQRGFLAVSLILLEYNCPLIVSHGGVFKVLADSLGYKNLQAANCSPFLFKPSENLWLVQNLANERL